MQEKIIKDIDAGIENLRAVKTLIDKIYYDAEYHAFFHRPILSTLDTAIDFLITNFELMKRRFLLNERPVRKGKE